MEENTPRLLKNFKNFFTSVPPEHRRQFAAVRLESNLKRMYALSLYIIVVQILLNVINIIKPSESKSSDILIYVGLSLFTLLVGILYCSLFIQVRKGRITSKKVQFFLTESLLYVYIVIQLIFCTLNIISTGGINSYIIAILIIGMFPIISPKQSIPTILLAFTYLLLAMYFTRPVSKTWDSIWITDTWTNLIIITGLISCISVFIYQMFVSNFLQSMRLQQVNDDLEDTVHKRTLELEEQTKAANVASQAKSDFLARMSHEIRTPLHAIMGMTQIARKSTDNAKTLTSLNDITLASSHLLSILNDILDMSKIESGKFTLIDEPFNLCLALEEVHNIIALRCQEKGIVFMNNLHEITATWVIGDKLRLKQVLINILGNAVKFTPSQGKVIFLLTINAETKTHLNITFVIEDKGIGISGDQMSKLFVPFEQAHNQISPAYGGTGLGLAISQNLLERMGSYITVKSQPDQGSVFSFTLHLEKADSKQTCSDWDKPLTLNLRGQRILLVEDIEINRIIIQELLQETEVQVEEAFDGRQALACFEASPEGYFDLIFMDVQMPYMDGYEATQRIRELKRNDAKSVPIIAMTANAYKEDVAQAMASGMNGHLAKPVDIQAIMQVLEQLHKNS